MNIHVENHGSVALFRPMDAEAADLLADSSPEDAQFFGNAMVVEPRYVAHVMDALSELGADFA